MRFSLHDKGRFHAQNVVITGGSSGIGLAIARQFGRLGANLFLIARNRDRLKQAAKELRGLGNEVVVFSADVGVCDQVEGVIEKIAGDYGGVHTLINNAGTNFFGKLENNSIEQIEYALQVNYMGMIYCLKAAWPYLKQADCGHVGFVSSVGGYLGAFGYGSYCPTKFAVTGLAECLRMEAADCGVGVTVIFPPDTDTPMLRDELENTLPECKALSEKSGLMAADRVAGMFVAGIINYRFEVICNLESRILRIWKAIFPRRYYKFLDDIVEKDRRRRGERQSSIYSR